MGFKRAPSPKRERLDDADKGASDFESHMSGTEAAKDRYRIKDVSDESTADKCAADKDASHEQADMADEPDGMPPLQLSDLN